MLAFSVRVLYPNGNRSDTREQIHTDSSLLFLL